MSARRASSICFLSDFAPLPIHLLLAATAAAGGGKQSNKISIHLVKKIMICLQPMAIRVDDIFAAVGSHRLCTNRRTGMSDHICQRRGRRSDGPIPSLYVLPHRRRDCGFSRARQIPRFLLPSSLAAADAATASEIKRSISYPPERGFSTTPSVSTSVKDTRSPPVRHLLPTAVSPDPTPHPLPLLHLPPEPFTL